MAGAHCALSSFLPPSATASLSHKNPSRSLSTISTRFPSKLTRRKNHLRQKLLKTITKPYPLNPLIPQLPPKTPVIPVEPLLQIAVEEINGSETLEFQIFENLEQFSGGETEELETRESQVVKTLEQFVSEESEELEIRESQAAGNPEHFAGEETEELEKQYAREETEELETREAQVVETPKQFAGEETKELEKLFAGEETRELQTRESQIVEALNTSRVAGDDFGIFSARSGFFKFGLYMVGAFVFQRIYAAWLYSSVYLDQEEGDLDSGVKTTVLELDRNENNVAKPGVLLNGSGNSSCEKLVLEQSALEEKLGEIQAMARDAREKEKSDLNANGSNGDDDFLSGIVEDVDRKLVKLANRLRKSGEKLVVPLSFLRKAGENKDGIDRESSDIEDGDDPLMFKKKYKFKSPSADLGDKPKGFQASKDHTVTSISSSSVVEHEPIRNGSVDYRSVDLLDKEQKLDQPNDHPGGSVSLSLEEESMLNQPNGNSGGSVSLPLEEESGRRTSKGKFKSVQTVSKKLGNGRVKEKPERGFGATRQTGLGKPSVKTGKWIRSGMLNAQNSQGLTKAVQGTTTIPNDRDTLLQNGVSESREVEIKRAAGKVEDKQSDDKTDFWWLRLPYVLAIYMRRGHNGEGSRGLFTLQTTPNTNDEVDVSHTVGFEDHGDATKFCYLLESFFEDLGDVCVDIVRLSIKELVVAVSSGSMKVFVVKKGQLKLYPGQPLAKAEMALRSLIRQS